jgi:hypothetical protein
MDGRALGFFKAGEIYPSILFSRSGRRKTEYGKQTAEIGIQNTELGIQNANAKIEDKIRNTE